MKKFALLGMALCTAALADEMAKPELKFKGDVRFRGDWAYTEYDAGHADFKKSGPNSERWLQAGRARLGATFGQGNWMAGMRLATGYGMPNTANQAMDNSFISKQVSFDRFYLALSNKFGTEEGLFGQSDVNLGKMNSPFLRGKATQEMIWHGETAPEGADWNVQYGSKSLRVQARVGRFWVDEIEKERNAKNTSQFVPDVFLQSEQLGLEFKSDLFSARLGGGSHYYNDLKGHQVLGLDSTKSFGNSSSIPDTATKAKVYTQNFNLVDGYLDLSTKIAGVPFGLGAAYVQNNEAEGENSRAWMAGVKLGEAKKKGQMELSYAFRQVGADAVVGVTSSSDLNAYSTNSRGHVVSMRYLLTDNLSYDLIGHLGNEVGITTADQGKQLHFNRIRTELNASF